jgi:rhamnose utilization protein RhaD (predicted bifunctional aldolase and dehydrogenase)
MSNIQALIEISRHYGNDPAFVIAGGGNTSLKEKGKLFIKASGVSLASIDKEGFAVMSRERLSFMEDKQYSKDPVRREEEVKADLKQAIIRPEHLRPSVETSLHNLIDHAYVIHTHPTLVNAVLCANDAQKEVEERFGTGALYVEYTDPGYILFKKLQAKIRTYRLNHGIAPKIIFLQNHGVFVGANSTQEVKDIYRSIESGIGEQKDLGLPAGKMEGFQSETSSFVADHYATRDLLTKAFRNPLSDHFSASRDQYQKISRPFTPDIIVYCKSSYLFLEKGMKEDKIDAGLRAFEENFGYYPKVVVEEEGGLIIIEESEKSIQTVLDVFTDMMKISYLSEQFGGPHFMSDAQISFIDNWEVENYRRSVAKEK